MARNTKGDAPYAEFGRTLTQLRKDAELTRDQLAEAVGINTRTLANYESGSRIPYADTAADIASYFGITVDELLGRHSTYDEQAKARAADELGRVFGAKGRGIGNAVIAMTGEALNAGGTMTAEDRTSFINTMQIILAQATLAASQKFTPYSLRSEEWEQRTAEQAAAVAEMTRNVEARAADEAGTDSSFFDDEEFHD